MWNFLKERKNNHTILFSTQFMDEADILAGESWVLYTDSVFKGLIRERFSLTSVGKKRVSFAMRLRKGI